MKKCASCTKDLPDAALHCVFCGAKQPPAPASPQGLAKTVMGYSASEMIEQLKQQGGNAPAVGRQGPPPQAQPQPQPQSQPQAQPFNPTPAAAMQFAPPSSGPTPQVQAQQRSGPSSQPPYAPPQQPGPAYGATAVAPPNAYAATAAAPPNQPFLGNNAPTAFAQPSPFANPAPLAQPPHPHTPQPNQHPQGLAPASNSAAKTVMAPAANYPNPPANQGAAGRSWIGSANVAPTPYGGPTGSSGPSNQLPPHMQPSTPAVQVSPAAAIPANYAGNTSARVGRPIEPWKDSLRMVMLVWGAILLAAFATPISIDPLTGNWNAIIDGEGMAKILPIVLAAVGLISVIFSSVPMSPAPRGFIAVILGLAGYMLPWILGIVNGVPFAWQAITMLGAFLLLIPGLLIRQQYRDALLPRLMVTFGALAYLALHLVPVGGGDIPLIGEFTAIIDAEGLDKVVAILNVFPTMIVVLSLLVWLPAPAPGGANLWAFTLLLWPLIAHFVIIGLHIDLIGDQITAKPNEVVFGGWAEMVPYLAIYSFGMATVLGKRLE